MQRAFLRSADLIVGLGYDTIEVEYEAWIGDVPLLQIDIEPADVAPSVKLVHQVTGDLDHSLARARRAARRQQYLDARQRSPSIAAAFRRRCGRRARPSPHTRRSTRCAARCRATACSSSTSARTPTRSPANGPRTRPRAFHITNGWSSMGFGLPGAIAAKLARPDLPVVCLIGDGCFQMTCGEVAVAKRLGLTLPDRRARRPLARADQGQADPAPVPALRHRAAGRGVSRAARALFRRAGDGRAQRRRAGGGGEPRRSPRRARP